MPLTESRKRANRKYDKEHTMILGCKVRREKAAHIKEVAAENGTNVSAILLKALDDFLEEHNEPYQK